MLFLLLIYAYITYKYAEKNEININDFRFMIDCEQNTIYTTTYGYMGLAIDKISTNKKDLQYDL